MHLVSLPETSKDDGVDYNKLLEICPKGSAQAREVERALRSLSPRVEDAQKREVDEMMGKLKGIGNTVLGQSV